VARAGHAAAQALERQPADEQAEAGAAGQTEPQGQVPVGQAMRRARRTSCENATRTRAPAQPMSGRRQQECDPAQQRRHHAPGIGTIAIGFCQVGREHGKRPVQRADKGQDHRTVGEQGKPQIAVPGALDPRQHAEDEEGDRAGRTRRRGQTGTGSRVEGACSGAQRGVVMGFRRIARDVRLLAEPFHFDGQLHFVTDQRNA